MTDHKTLSRVLEDVGFVVGLLMMVGYVGLVEILPALCHALGKCQNAPADTPFPWVVVTMAALCVAPKMIGRASAGKVWESLAGRLGKKVDG